MTATPTTPATTADHPGRSRLRRTLTCLLVVTLAACALLPQDTLALRRCSAIRQGSVDTPRMRHGVFPGGFIGEEDDITPAGVASYERTVMRGADWVYFSNNWYRSRAFPAETARWIRARGSTPYIRLMLRSDAEQDHAEPRFTLQRIADGAFDGDLRAWARGARAYGKPIRVEFGTEVNGEWFPWNGKWNGAGAKTGFGDPAKSDGPERFVAAYRHIVTVMRSAGARNIRWVFHVNAHDWPETSWNRFENYYPGDAFVNELAVSAYGTQSPEETEADTFREMMDAVYPRLTAMAPGKPILVAEFGTDVRNPSVNAAAWTRGALADLLGRRWPDVAGFAWWNEWWPNDDDPTHDTTMRVQDSRAVARVFRGALRTLPPSAARVGPRSRLSAVRSWALALGRDMDAETMSQLRQYDLVVVDGEAVTAAQVRSLRADGIIVLGYLSVGTIEPWRSWFGQVKAYRLDLWGDWDEWYADVSAPGYRKVIADEVAPAMLAKGLDGLFLDNVDMIETHPSRAPGMQALVGTLSARAHAQGRLLFAQNGADTIAPMLAYLDGWNLEDVTRGYDFDAERYVRIPAEDVAYNLQALRGVRAAGLFTTATDYVAAGDTAATDEAVRNARSAGALPFVSDIELTRLPPPPVE